MKRFITLLFTLYAVLLQPLAADASYFPQTTITNNTEIGCRADTGFITPAATTGDVSELLGSASKTLYIKRVLVNLAVVLEMLVQVVLQGPEVHKHFHQVP